MTCYVLRVAVRDETASSRHLANKTRFFFIFAILFDKWFLFVIQCRHTKKTGRVNMPSIRLSERIYFSDNHEHIELFYSFFRRPVGGKKGEKTTSSKKEQKEIITNAEKTIAFSASSDTEGTGEALAKKKRSQEESLNRTKRDMTRFLNSRLYGHHIRFITLTYAKAPESEKQARKDLYACMDRFSLCVGRKVQWMAVPEHGSENGRFHWHVLLNSHYVRNEVFQKQYWKLGFVKVEKVKSKKNHTQAQSALHYMMKYISKDLEAGNAWKHRWFHSRGDKKKTVTSGHVLSDSEYKEFLLHLGAFGFVCDSVQTWHDVDFGFCEKRHFTRRLSQRNSERNVLSYFAEMKNLKADINYYGFAVSGKIEELAKGECEDFPVLRDWLANDTVKEIYYETIRSAERYLWLQDWYYKQLYKVWVPVRLSYIEKGMHLPQAYKELVSSGKIESFAQFLCTYSYFYEPIYIKEKEI